MTGHRIVDYIESKVLELKYKGLSPFFYHGDKAEQNSVTKAGGALVFLDHAIISEPILTASGNVNDNFTLVFFFGLLSRLDFTMKQHNECIGPMRGLISRFQNILYKDTENIQTLRFSSTLDMKNVFDDNYTGAAFTVQITLYDNTSAC